MAVALLLIIVAVVLLMLASRLRASSGLPTGQVIYSDTGAWQRNEQALFSAQRGLTGKPDYLIRQGRAIIPVEVKSGPAPRTPRDSHVMQLAAYCALVEETLRAEVPLGIIKYDDRVVEIAWDDDLRNALDDTLRNMRADLDAGEANRSHTEPWRCRNCGVRDACDERLAAT
jgi:CRISPR-associated exonuclease Cas4